MKKFLLVVLFMILLFGIVFCGGYFLLSFIVENEKIGKLEKYELASGEKILEEFNYDGRKYAVSSYLNDSSILHILLRTKGNFYILETVGECSCSDDGRNIYVKDNIIYVHCIGYREIFEFKVDDVTVEKATRKFNFDDTSNFSQLHMGIDKVDDDYIYFSSFLLDTTEEGEDKVKCSFDDKVCSYITK